MTLQAHATAFLGLLSAASGSPTLVVHDGKVPTGALPPYVVVYFAFSAPPAEGDLQTSNLNAASVRQECWAYCHNVGATTAAARAVAARTQAALLDVTPVVASRKAWPISHYEGQPAAHDETTGVAVFDQVDVYRLSTVPG